MSLPCIAVLLPLAAMCVVPQTADAIVLESICDTIKSQMIRDHIPSVAVAVFDKGSIRSHYCNVSGTGVSQQSVFEAASLSKPLFAIGVLKLVLDHRLDLDKPLISYLSHGYEHQQNPFTGGATDVVKDPLLNQVTARMVLDHTAGLPNWALGPLRFINVPGAKWSYSGEGYVYLQRAVEEITHVPLETYMQQAVLNPLGMVHSAFVWRSQFEAAAMVGHDAQGRAEPIAHDKHAVAPTTLYTTLPDYTLFASHLLRPGSASTYVLEENPQVSVRPDLRLKWGLGVAIEDTNPMAFFHWGSNPGFQSFFMCQPETGRAVLFLTDSDNGLNLIDPIVKVTVPGRHPVLRFPMLHPKN